jgi:hypothetical protein
VVEVVYAPATRRSITDQVRVLLEVFWFALLLGCGLLMTCACHGALNLLLLLKPRAARSLHV